MKRLPALLLAMVLVACGTRPQQPAAHPDWSYNSVVYEMNVRQYTPEGTLAAAARHLPRLRELGVDVVWLMPVYPIGVKERKGTLGSYYAISDYEAVNPEFGTLEDFDRVLKCGADKVSVNSGALKNPDLIPAAAQRYGNQCVVLSADVKRVDGQFRVFAKGGREDTGRDALDWISWCVDHGAGEICLNSIDTDGVRSGFDLEMLDAVAARVNVPIIASGGAGKKEDFLELFHHKGIDAGLAAGIFHQKLLTIRDLKEYLNANGVEMRL